MDVVTRGERLRQREDLSCCTVVVVVFETST